MSGYIDDNFVLRGSKPTILEKSGEYMTNSELTSTTRRLTQNSLYRADNYRDLRRSFQSPNPPVKEDTIRRDVADELYRDTLLTREKWAAERAKRLDYEWYLRPPHLTKNVESPVNSLSRKLTMPERSRSPPATTSSYFRRREDDLAMNYFPVTLGASFALSSNSIKSPYNIDDLQLKKEVAVRTKSLSKPRPMTAFPLTSVDKMYNSVIETPVTGASSVFRITPYCADVDTLRMKQLQLEEQILLEIKRQEELENMRGPKPKWYELRTPQFHYEAHKNNTLLKHEAHWQDLVDYRNELVSASKQLLCTAAVL